MKNRNFLPCSDTRCVSVLVFMVYAVVGYEMQHNQRCTFFCASFTLQNRKDRKMKVTCPECNQEYEVDESMRGQKVYCIKDNCPGEILVPKKMLKKHPAAATPQVSEKSVLKGTKYFSYASLEKMQKMFDWQKRMLAFLIFSLLLSVFFFACAANANGNAILLSFAKTQCKIEREAHMNAVERLEHRSKSSYYSEAEVREAEIAAEEAKNRLDAKKTSLNELIKEYGENPEETSDFYFAVARVILCVSGIFLIIFMVQHWIFIHCGWSLVPRDKAVTTPNKAIWLNFVPGLMFFWNWVSYFELGRHYSELTGRRGNKVLALIVSVMTTLGGPVLLLAWVAILLVMQGELLRSAEIIVKEKDFDD